MLAAWSARCPRPLVVFIDEIDALEGAALISVLRQIRSGFPNRPGGFPHSVGLIGMRDVRDYKVASGGSITMRGFDRAEIGALYAQHTADTGQVFEPAAVDRAWELTQGQPWLVNALANQCVGTLVRDRARPIGAREIDAAKELLIKRRDTHLDSLAERLREPRVKRIIEPMLASDTAITELPEDDVRYVADLGLVSLVGIDAFATTSRSRRTSC